LRSDAAIPIEVAPNADIYNAHTWLRAIAEDLRDYASGELEATPGALYRLAATLDDVCDRASSCRGATRARCRVVVRPQGDKRI
jgi:hypothetical protein